ncbi:MAG: tRNA 5-methoxyuridine(34)/uridine 5-oxyacetic acid(34) synthase CmoB [Cardiobacteriaceae bacterium]|nr:tRNA 5-methoxyuridine(34)/uridine 5-oxyacetic acid(34) synthase CmoB [Cardiobacteriaceae bacterium]
MRDVASILMEQLERAYDCQPALPLLELQSALLEKIAHGQFETWVQQIEDLSLSVDEAYIQAVPQVKGAVEQSALLVVLHDLKPWRKGHFDLWGIDLDGEWRSELKYERLSAMGIDVQDKTILDVGCGNGYYMLRLLGDGAKSVVGIDPSFHYLAQYCLLSRAFPVLSKQSAFLPVTLDDAPFSDFDVTLSMGVLYHRKDPLLHLKQLATTLHDEGILILETLILPSDKDECLEPTERYAGMRNVYHLPSTKRLVSWLNEAGLQVLDISEPCQTTTTEQRKTAWIDSYSLDAFLSPDQCQTIEGYPPPTRQILVAKRF